MSRLETEYNGVTIHYSENEDIWRCDALEVDGKTLSAVKEKIGKLQADARRISVPVLVIRSSYGGVSIESEGTASLLHDDGKHVWVNTVRVVWVGANRMKRREERGRSKFLIESLFHDTPEARSLVSDVAEKVANLEAEIKRERSRLDVLPRLDLSDIRKTPEPSHD